MARVVKERGSVAWRHVALALREIKHGVYPRVNTKCLLMFIEWMAEEACESTKLKILYG